VDRHSRPRHEARVTRDSLETALVVLALREVTPAYDGFPETLQHEVLASDQREG